MSTIQFGPNTFAILANTPTTLANVMFDAGATHFVKCYASGCDFSGDQTLMAVDVHGSVTTHDGTVVWGLLHRIDRDASTDTYVYGRGVRTDDGHTNENNSSFPLDIWGESEFVPLYLVGTPLPADTARLMPAEVGPVPALLSLRDAQSDATPVPALSTVPVLPRTAQAATALAAKLQDFARWLPGGELEGIAHEHADQANLCGEYERIVCPTFGWTPRRGEENSMARFSSQFFTELDTFEREHAHLAPLDRLARWMDRYQSGGFANRAVNEHAENHLESHKIDGVNTLLSEVLNWETIDQERAYEVRVRVSRSITIDVEQWVNITVTASDEDDAGERVDSYSLADYVSDYDWQDENGSTHYASTRSNDITDWDVEEVEPV